MAFLIDMVPMPCGHCGERIWTYSGDPGPVFCHIACQDLYEAALTNAAPEREPNGAQTCLVSSSLSSSSCSSSEPSSGIPPVPGGGGSSLA